MNSARLEIQGVLSMSRTEVGDPGMTIARSYLSSASEGY